MRISSLLVISSFLIISACSSLTITHGPYFGNGFHNGWADQHSIVIWTRLTQNPEMNLEGHPFTALSKEMHNHLDQLGISDSIHAAQIPDSLTLADMEGACPGARGEVKFVYYPLVDPGASIETPW
ncbi:MAG: hypothetical protein KAT15_28440, partial [Bacteroidales bacterium]|nr:hypothetical protein [Bacteroidales bacterium]